MGKVSTRKPKPGGSGSGRRLPPLGDPLDRPISHEINTRIKAAKRIVVAGHERPDGDCIGSCIALCAILRKQGHDAVAIATEAPPERFRFLHGGEFQRLVKPGEQLAADLALVLDTTGLDRLAPAVRKALGSIPLVNIDHHLSNENFGEINWVDSTAAAAGELVWRLAACCGWQVPGIALEGLYTALVTDTGQFAYSNTTPRILRMAAELVEAGVDPEETWRRIYLEKTEEELKLETVARGSLELWADGAISAIGLRQDDFAAAGAGPEATQEFPGIPRALKGAKLALFFYEVDNGKTTKVSIRSVRDLDACALAQQFGGGGHRQAAGCSFPLPLNEAKARFRPAAEAAVREVVNGNGQ